MLKQTNNQTKPHNLYAGIGFLMDDPLFLERSAVEWFVVHMRAHTYNYF